MEKLKGTFPFFTKVTNNTVHALKKFSTLHLKMGIILLLKAPIKPVLYIAMHDCERQHNFLHVSLCVFSGSVENIIREE